MNVINLQAHRDINKIRLATIEFRQILANIDCETGGYSEHSHLVKDLNVLLEKLENETLSSIELEAVAGIQQWITIASGDTSSRFDCIESLMQVIKIFEKSIRDAIVSSK